MSGGEIAAILTAIAAVVGSMWTVWHGRQQTKSSEGSALWHEMLNVIQTLKDENARLLAENLRLRDRLALIERAIEREIPLPPPKVVDSNTTSTSDLPALAPAHDQE